MNVTERLNQVFMVDFILFILLICRKSVCDWWHCNCSINWIGYVLSIVKMLLLVFLLCFIFIECKINELKTRSEKKMTFQIAIAWSSQNASGLYRNSLVIWCARSIFEIAIDICMNVFYVDGLMTNHMDVWHTT